jgi:hypothetical protein
MNQDFTDEDMAAVGRALMNAISAHAYPGWSPAQCPSEIVGDLRSRCDELNAKLDRLRPDAERYRWIRANRIGVKWCELYAGGPALDEAVDSAMSQGPALNYALLRDAATLPQPKSEG